MGVLFSALAYKQNMLKYVVTACRAYLWSKIPLHSSRHLGTVDRLAYYTNALSGITIKVSIITLSIGYVDDMLNNGLVGHTL